MPEDKMCRCHAMRCLGEAMLCDAMRFCAKQCDVMRYDAVRCNVVQRDSVQYSGIPYRVHPCDVMPSIRAMRFRAMPGNAMLAFVRDAIPRATRCDSARDAM